ncbi:MAG TPA: glucoamylase family protein, partial [Gemmatimonadales bacterium]|nr:glucoamylase family protein [Gemmatimonadales bacterium]
GNIWGLTACDGPANKTLTIGGKSRQYHTYDARGAALNDERDDGTICPTAAGGAVPFAPEFTIPALLEMNKTYGAKLFQKYGFLDAFNPTFTAAGQQATGTVDPRLGWFDVDYLGIDQGPILAMIENYRSGFVWRVMRGNAHIIAGLKRAGFTGGWLP